MVLSCQQNCHPVLTMACKGFCVLSLPFFPALLTAPVKLSQPQGGLACCDSWSRWVGHKWATELILDSFRDIWGCQVKLMLWVCYVRQVKLLYETSRIPMWNTQRVCVRGEPVGMELGTWIWETIGTAPKWSCKRVNKFINMVVPLWKKIILGVLLDAPLFEIV